MMPDTVTQAIFFETAKQLTERIDANHKSMRQLIEEKFLQLDGQLDSHAKDDLKVEKRVDKLEWDKTKDRETAFTRSTIASAVIAPAAIAIWEIMKHAMGWLK